jgi:dTDP-4-dehydrorhamnose 3,5-epimerase-like enzyme
MINIRPVTAEELKLLPTDVIVTLPKSFEDARGSIQPLVDIQMESCVLITSKMGTVRANHYHKTDWHYCYVLSGEIKYYHRPHGNLDTPQELLVKAGQMFFTPPLVDHAMVFIKDTQFLTWGRNSRAQEVYEADICRISPINP